GESFIGDVDQPGGGITFDAAGHLFVLMVGVDDACDNTAFCLYQVDPANPGGATFVGAGPGETFLYGLTANCAGGVYTTELQQQGPTAQSDVQVALGGNVLMSVNTTAGSFTAVGTDFGGNNRIQSMDYSAEGVLHAIGSQFASAHKGFLSTGFLYTV